MPTAIVIRSEAAFTIRIEISYGRLSMPDVEESVPEGYDHAAGRADVLLTRDAYPAYESVIDIHLRRTRSVAAVRHARPPPGAANVSGPAGPDVRNRA